MFSVFVNPGFCFKFILCLTVITVEKARQNVYSANHLFVASSLYFSQFIVSLRFHSLTTTIAIFFLQYFAVNIARYTFELEIKKKKKHIFQGISLSDTVL